MGLKDTIKMMESNDYKERFRAEYWQVRIRLEKLESMIKKWENRELDFIPTCPKSIYCLQINVMQVYINLLEARAELENIEL